MNNHSKTVPLMRIHNRLLLLLISGLTLSCASQKASVLPQDGPTMEQVYAQHMTTLKPTPSLRHPIQALPPRGIAHYRGFVREAANDINTLFPRLPNPTLVMYIFPHLSGEERSPVPGYVTTFPFYERVEYALPDEVPGEESDEVPDEVSSEVPSEVLDEGRDDVPATHQPSK